MMYTFDRAGGYAGHGASFAGGIFGHILLIAILAIVVALIVNVIRRRHLLAGCCTHSTATLSQIPGTSTTDDAISIARDRLARGEIEPEQYRAIVEALQN